MIDLENMTNHQKKWWLGMIRIHGTEERVREVVGSGGKIGGAAKGLKGLGSPKVSKEKKSEIQRLGLEARKAK